MAQAAGENSSRQPTTGFLTSNGPCGRALLAPENEKSCYLLPSAPISHLVLVCLFLYQRLDCRAGALPTRGSAHPLVLLNTSHIKRPPSNRHFALVAAGGFLHQRPSASSPGLSFFVTASFVPMPVLYAPQNRHATGLATDPPHPRGPVVRGFGLVACNGGLYLPSGTGQ